MRLKLILLQMYFITGDVLELLSSLNFDLMKCYEGVFDIRNAKVNVGGFIMLGFIVAQIAFMIVYMVKGLDSVRKFVDSYVTNKGNPPHKGKANEFIITKNDNTSNNSQVTIGDEINQTYNTDTNRRRLISTQTRDNLTLKDVNNSESIDYDIPFQPTLKPSKLMVMVVNHQNDLYLNKQSIKKQLPQKLRFPKNRRLKRSVPRKHIHKNVRLVNLKRKTKSNTSKENTCYRK